jgi:hypothetical protein
VEEEFVAEAVEGAEGDGLHYFDEDGGADDVDPPEFEEEVLGPAFEHFAEGEEVEDGGVEVYECEGVGEVGVEMLDLAEDVVFEFFPQLGAVECGVEEEEVGGGYLSQHEYARLNDRGKVFVHYAFHAFVEERVVRCHQLLHRLPVLEYLRTVCFSTHAGLLNY